MNRSSRLFLQEEMVWVAAIATFVLALWVCVHAAWFAAPLAVQLLIVLRKAPR